MPAALFAAFAIAVMPPDNPLETAVMAADTRLFDLFFEGCDPAGLRAMLTDDFEFFDDRGGLVATDADSFVEQYAGRCRDRSAPDAWRSRREALVDTLAIYPIHDYGAVETGEHVFYERQGDGPETRVGLARFTQMWKQDGTDWKLARVFSYDHSALP
ncbi:MAG: nuclear transport factor 2 family protein [Brevundimonas sp.]|uniref:nuclear transport factor 2 family protein n=1 Tax=Brevundimonas sp. TaxID=1871086 RepID=UPI0028D5C291|nr:nuclear transport factor 2 family protein [uncultured Brevundimonas sp.]